MIHLKIGLLIIFLIGLVPVLIYGSLLNVFVWLVCIICLIANLLVIEITYKRKPK